MNRREHNQSMLSDELTLQFLSRIADGVDKIAGIGKTSGVKAATSSVEVLAKLDDKVSSSIDNILSILSDSKKVKLLEQGTSVLSAGIDAIATSMVKLAKTESTLDSLSNTLSNVIDVFKNTAKPILMITGSLALLAATAIMYGQSNMTASTASIVILLSSLAGGLWIIKRINAPEISKDILILTGALGILGAAAALIGMLPMVLIGKGLLSLTLTATTLALVTKIMPKPKTTEDFTKSLMSISAGILAFGLAVTAASLLADFITPKGILFAVGSMAALAGAVLLVGLAKKGVANGAKAMLDIATALAIMPVALKVWDYVKPDSWLKPALALVSLTVATAFVGKVGRNVKQGAISMLLMTASLALIPLVLKLYDSVSYESMIKPGIVLTALTLATVFVGSNAAMSMKGAVAMAIISGSLMLTAVAIRMFDKVEWSAFAKAGAAISLGALLAKVLGMPPISSFALSGALALGAIGGALFLFGKALTSFPNKLSIGDYMTIAGGVATLAGAVAIIGNPFTLPFTLAGAAASAAIGGSLYLIGKALKQVETIDATRAIRASTSIMKWAKTTTSSMAKLSVKDMIKARISLTSMKALGTTLASLAIGVSMMANGTFSEYNPDGSVRAIHKIGPAEYAAVGDSIANIVTAVTDPLSNFGQDGNLFMKSSAELGIQALSGLGEVTEPIISLAKNVNTLKGKDFSPFGEALALIVSQLAEPLATVAAGDHTFLGIGKNVYEDGLKTLSELDSIVKPVLDLGPNVAKLKDVDFSPFGEALALIVSQLAEPLATVAAGDHTFLGIGKNVYEDGLKTLSSIGAITAPMLELADAQDSLSKFNSAAFASKLTNVAKGIKNSFGFLNGIDIGDDRVRVITETAEALSKIDRVNLTKLDEVNKRQRESLFKKLDEIILAINKSGSFKTVPASGTVTNVNLIKDVKEGQSNNEALLLTISEQLDTMIALLGAQS